MLGALIIVFREVLEAGLIVGIVMAATKDLPGRGHWIMLGVGAGIAGAAVVALSRNAFPRHSKAPARNCSMPPCSAPRW